ncbi:hypothetical protein QF035_000235 [Streptomyces umbrinus]|uniref:ANTAR domain-containing protein n=1 Tax=Streptomyces umbrinus TaxID=67370 RepID=A0ABU0SGF9_9ACTN|nr:hypothetical protein [Streptomyces umbrinus]
MRLDQRLFGSLTLLCTRTGHLSDDDLHLAQALADSAALAFMHWSLEPARSDDLVTRVHNAIAAKATFDIAKGMVAAYAGVAISEATHLLTDYATWNLVRLGDTVQALVSRTMEPAVILVPRTRG